MAAQKIGQARADQKKPPERRDLEPGSHGQQRNAGEAAQDVDAVSMDAAGNTLQAATQLLARPQHHGGHGDEHRRVQDLCRDRPGRLIRAQSRCAQEDLQRPAVLRYPEAEEVAGLVMLRQGGQGGGQSQDRRRRAQQMAGTSRGQASQRHSQKTGEQNRVGEKREEKDVCREPANAGQLQEQQQSADQEQVKVRALHGVYLCCDAAACASRFLRAQSGLTTWRERPIAKASAGTSWVTVEPAPT